MAFCCTAAPNTSRKAQFMMWVEVWFCMVDPRFTSTFARIVSLTRKIPRFNSPKCTTALPIRSVSITSNKNPFVPTVPASPT